jgi:hypothetical protein
MIMRKALMLGAGLALILGVTAVYFILNDSLLVGLGDLMVSILLLSTARVMWKKAGDHPQ